MGMILPCLGWGSALASPIVAECSIYRAQLYCIMVDVSLFSVCFKPLGYCHRGTSQQRIANLCQVVLVLPGKEQVCKRGSWHAKM